MDYFEITLPESDGQTAEDLYTPEIVAEADMAIFPIQVVAFAGGISGDLKVFVQHKNVEDTSYSDVDTSIATVTISDTDDVVAVEVDSDSSSRLKELCRLRIEQKLEGTVRLEFLPPLWYNKQG